MVEPITEKKIAELREALKYSIKTKMAILL